MSVEVRVVQVPESGTALLHVYPCFYAGGEAGTVTDSLAGAIAASSYKLGDMPFIQGDLTIVGEPNASYALYFDWRA